MSDWTAKQSLTLEVPPEQVELFQGCYEALGYRLESARPQEHADTVLTLRLEDESACDPEKFAQCQGLLGRLKELNAVIVRYYLKIVCGVGLVGAVCIGLSFVALHFKLHALFTILLILGIFGCTITLYLRPAIYRRWMKKYGGEVPGILSQLEELLGIQMGRRPE